MATSGSVDFNLTRNDIIIEAMELIGATDIGEAPTAEEITSCSRTLNILIKSLQTEGVYIWKTRDFYVFPQLSEKYIDLGPTGGHATLTYNKTEISTIALTGASTIAVDSDDGITDGDYIGIELDDGTLQWTTVNGTPSGDVVTITDVLIDDVSVDSHVYSYTTKINRPSFLLNEGRLLEGIGEGEVPFLLASRNEFNSISTKTADGNPHTGWYDPRTITGRLNIWPASNNVKNILILTGKFPIEDFDSSTDDADFPHEWYLALVWNLAALIAPKFLHSSMDAIFEQKAATYIQAAIANDRDYGSIYFEQDA